MGKTHHKKHKHHIPEGVHHDKHGLNKDVEVIGHDHHGVHGHLDAAAVGHHDPNYVGYNDANLVGHHHAGKGLHHHHGAAVIDNGAYGAGLPVTGPVGHAPTGVASYPPVNPTPHKDLQDIGKHGAALAAAQHVDPAYHGGAPGQIYHGEKPTMGNKIKHEMNAIGEKVKEKAYAMKGTVGSQESKANDKFKAQQHAELYQQEKLAAKGQFAGAHHDPAY